MALHKESIDSILANYHITDAIVILQNERKEYPEMPISRPIAHGLSTPEQYEEYANKLRAYNEQKTTYKAKKREIEDFNASIDDKTEELIKFECSLHKLPKWQQAKVWNYAYEKGYSGGYYGIYSTLFDIMDLFEE